MKEIILGNGSKINKTEEIRTSNIFFTLLEYSMAISQSGNHYLMFDNKIIEISKKFFNKLMSMSLEECHFFRYNEISKLFNNVEKYKIKETEKELGR